MRPHCSVSTVETLAALCPPRLPSPPHGSDAIGGGGGGGGVNTTGFLMVPDDVGQS